MIKIGLRDNLKYPRRLLLFILITRIDEIAIKKFLNFNVDHILSFFIFLPQIFGGLIPTLTDYIKNKKKSDDENKKNTRFQLISRENEMRDPEINDSKIKIMILIFVDSYFNFLTIIIGKHSFINGDKRILTEFVEKRLRGAQMIFAAFLCYLTIRTEMHRHHIFSLIVIFTFLIIIISLELLWLKTNILTLSIFIFCYFIRAFLDTIEKYMFDVNYANPIKILLWEGIFGTIFYIIYELFNKDAPIKEIKSIIIDGEKIKQLFLLFCLLFYSVISALRSLYRIHTVQYFSPMGRALFEFLLDPVTVIFYLLKDKKEIKNDIKYFWIYFSIIISFLFIMFFFSLVYNEFIVLYCCGLEYNTYIAIRDRSISYNVNNGLIDDDEENLRNNNNEKGKELTS